MQPAHDSGRRAADPGGLQGRESSALVQMGDNFTIPRVFSEFFGLPADVGFPRLPRDIEEILTAASLIEISGSTAKTEPVNQDETTEPVTRQSSFRQAGNRVYTNHILFPLPSEVDGQAFNAAKAIRMAYEAERARSGRLEPRFPLSVQRFEELFAPPRGQDLALERPAWVLMRKDSMPCFFGKNLDTQSTLAEACGQFGYQQTPFVAFVCGLLVMGLRSREHLYRDQHARCSGWAPDDRSLAAGFIGHNLEIGLVGKGGAGPRLGYSLCRIFE